MTLYDLDCSWKSSSFVYSQSIMPCRIVDSQSEFRGFCIRFGKKMYSSFDEIDSFKAKIVSVRLALRMRDNSDLDDSFDLHCSNAQNTQISW